MDSHQESCNQDGYKVEYDHSNGVLYFCGYYCCYGQCVWSLLFFPCMYCWTEQLFKKAYCVIGDKQIHSQWGWMDRTDKLIPLDASNFSLSFRYKRLND